jgi:hypothetical protein
LAKRLNQQIPNSIILDQYSNPANPDAHYYGTAEEIIAACGRQQPLDMVVMGAGTGGTISGTARRLKEVYPGIKVIGVDPLGSLLADPQNAPSSPHFNQPYLVEGIGYDFVPRVMSHEHVDDWIVSTDAPAFKMARELIAVEGVLCGGSSGSAMWAALEAIKRHGMNQPGKRVLVLLPDSVRNYMSKFLSADWMFANEFMDVEEYIRGKEYEQREEENAKNAAISILTFNASDSIARVLSALKKYQGSPSASLFPVLSESEDKKPIIVGVLDSAKLLDKALSLPRSELEAMPLKRFLNKDFVTVKSLGTAALYKCAAKVPVYLVDEQGQAKLDADGRCQLVDPFKLI